MDEETKVTDVVILKQLPVIEERLVVLRDEINAKVADALSLTCTEDTVKEIKKVRANLKKEAMDFEARRKDIKKQILAPYEQFEAVYKEYIGDLYKDADAELARRIGDVENSLKDEKREELYAYFAELCEANGLTEDDVAFEEIPVGITLSASMKSLKDATKQFVERVRDELAAIAKDANAEEVLIEYRKNKNLSQALLTVSERHRQMEEIRRRSEAGAEDREAEKVAEIDAILAEKADEEDAFGAPTVEAVETATTAANEDVYEIAFQVRGTLSALSVLKAFLVDNGYEYEQVQLV